ncbi:MAG: OmpA/MotB domain protein, partial [Bacteroidetes bacterium]|nr:OmpA/MotB domain protein [Bacteroidota bacterium]
MNKSIVKYLILVALIMSAFCGLQAQVSTMYYLKNNPYRHQLNPAFQPSSGFYIDLPLIPSLELSLGNNSLTMSDIIYPKLINGEMKTITFLDENGDKDLFYNALKSQTNFHTNVNMDIFSVGFRSGSSYFTFGVSQKFNMNATVPKDMFKLMLYGTLDTLNVNRYDMSSMNMSATAYTEYALGYSREINDRLSVGLKAKFLKGETNITAGFDKLNLNADRNKWNATIDGNINSAIPFTKFILSNAGRIDSIASNFPEPTSESGIDRYIDMAKEFVDVINPSGRGFAVDLGASYKVSDRLSVSAAVLDLGHINWKRNMVNVAVSGNFNFEGVHFEIDDTTNSYNDYTDIITDSLNYKTTFNPYKTSLQTKVMAGLEYYVVKDKISLGLLSKSTFINKKLYEELTTSVNFFPSNWFNASLSYSLLNGSFSNVGLGVNTHLGPFNMFLAG